MDISNKILEKDSSIKVSIEIKNTGKLKGKEVVQMYIKDRFASVTRPVRELKGFELVELSPGETKMVSFEISESLLKFYSANEVWESEPGFFDVFIGTDSNATINESFKLVEQ